MGRLFGRLQRMSVSQADISREWESTNCASCKSSARRRAGIQDVGRIRRQNVHAGVRDVESELNAAPPRRPRPSQANALPDLVPSANEPPGAWPPTRLTPPWPMRSARHRCRLRQNLMADRAPEGDTQETFLSHLVELRSRLLYSIIAVLAVFVALFPWSKEIYALLAKPMLNALPSGAQMIAPTSPNFSRAPQSGR